MYAPRKIVIVTRRLPEPVETRMMELFDTRISSDDHAMSQNELKEAVGVADILVPTVSDRIDAEILSAAGPRLRLIASYGTGVDHIDVAAARAHGITITNTPGVLTEDTADMTMGLIIAVARRLSEGERLLRTGEWGGWSPTFLLGHRLAGKRLGIIGMGRIGTAVAKRARGFGMTIHYHNRKRRPAADDAALEATYWDNLDQLLARMDVISINCPHTPGTHHLLSAQRLKLLQPHAMLINTARGSVVDEDALIKVLEDGRIVGAGLDVFESEPMINPRLLSLSNVVLLPHLGSATIESRIDMGQKVIVNIKAHVDGHRPPDRVFEQLL